MNYIDGWWPFTFSVYLLGYGIQRAKSVGKPPWFFVVGNTIEESSDTLCGLMLKIIRRVYDRSN